MTASLSLNEEKNFKEIDGKDGDTVANCFNFNIRSAKDLGNGNLDLRPLAYVIKIKKPLNGEL